MKKVALLILSICLLTSCQRGCQRFSKNTQSSDRNYEVTMYSGGVIVFKDSFKGIVTENKTSDGVFYFKGDSLIEVSGDYIIKSSN